MNDAQLDQYLATRRCAMVEKLKGHAADIVVTTGLGSTSLLQRRLKVGYSTAGAIMDELERLDIVGPPQGARPRDVLGSFHDDGRILNGHGEATGLRWKPEVRS